MLQMPLNLPSGTEAKASAGRNLRVYRVAAELTQAELAERAGVSPETVSNIERGAFRPSPLTKRALAEALSALTKTPVRVEDLFPASEGSPGE